MEYRSEVTQVIYLPAHQDAPSGAETCFKTHVRDLRVANDAVALGALTRARYDDVVRGLLETHIAEGGDSQKFVGMVPPLAAEGLKSLRDEVKEWRADPTQGTAPLPKDITGALALDYMRFGVGSTGSRDNPYGSIVE